MSIQPAARAAAMFAYRLRRKMRADLKPAFSEYRKGLTIRKRFEDADLHTKREHSLSELRTAVRRASEIPFWRERFLTAKLDWNRDFGFEEFSQLPPLERAEITGKGDALLADSVAPTQRRKMATGGSSGIPTTTWTGPAERGWARAPQNITSGESASVTVTLSPTCGDIVSTRLRGRADVIVWKIGYSIDVGLTVFGSPQKYSPNTMVSCKRFAPK